MHKYLFIKHTKAMKKLTYLAVAAVALGVASCNNSKPGYVITGTVEGASDGDTVFIQERVSRQFNNWIQPSSLTEHLHSKAYRIPQ